MLIARVASLDEIAAHAPSQRLYRRTIYSLMGKLLYHSFLQLLHLAELDPAASTSKMRYQVEISGQSAHNLVGLLADVKSITERALVRRLVAREVEQDRLWREQSPNYIVIRALYQQRQQRTS
jgi:hypothetical protein